MISRLFWALLGLGLGLVLGLRVLRVVEEAQSRAKPERIVKDAGRTVGSFQARLKDAVDEGRAAASASEAAMRDRFGVPTFQQLLDQQGEPQRGGDQQDQHDDTDQT